MTTTPKILGFDFTIPLGYLREGDEFITWDPDTRYFRQGVAHMDGHMVSEHYGFRAGNTYYTDNPQCNYINVRWSDMEYEWPSSRSFHTKIDGVWIGPNQTIYQKDNRVILVKEDVYERAWDDMATNNTKSNKALLLAEALAEVETAQAALEKAKKKVQEANRL
jgi:hypothetical protein